MRILTPEEFKKLYGENAVANFSAPVKAPAYTRQETNQDRIEMGSSLQKTIDISNQERQSTRARVESGEISPLEGTVQTIGQGLYRGGEFLGNTALGFAKMALPENVEQRIREKLGKDLQEVTDPKKAKAFVRRLETSDGGLLVSGDLDKALAEDIKDFNYKFQNDPNFKANTLATLGYAGTLTSLLTAPSKVKPGKVGIPEAPKVTPSATPKQVKPELPKVTPDEVVKQATKLRDDVRAYVGEQSVDPQVKASAERLQASQDPAFLRGTANRVEDVETKYNRYFTQSENAINDIKVDPAISEVGSKMGDSFESVIKQRQAVGKVLGKELDEWGKLRVSIKGAVDETLADLDGSGLSYNPRTRQLTSFQGSKFVPQEVIMLNDFVNRVKLLGDSPTVRQLDQFIARTRTALEFTKGESGVMGVTNAERIINSAVAQLKDSLNPNKNGIQQLSKYWQANSTYSNLSDFIDEGATFLGKKTQSGDFAKDASIAKSAVQSILNSGKKDWMLKLEALTGYNALDDAVLALQAMKDAGDFRGLSLLQAMKDSGIPTSRASFTGAIIDKGVDIGKRIIAGTPADQTRAFLKSLKSSTDLKVANKKVVAGKSVPKTKEVTTIEKKIAKNVDSQKAAIKAGDFELVAKLKEVYTKLVTELKSLIADYKKNGIPLGMSIRKSATPESVAKKSAPEDIKFLNAVIDDVKSAKADPEANKILDAMGLGKATDDELVSFAKEVIDEFDGVATRPVLLKATTPTTLLESKDGYLYHGTNESILDNIKKEGLKPGRRGQLSVSTTEEYAKTFAREGMTPTGKTESVLLRVKADALNGKTTTKRVDGKERPVPDQQNELLTKETIAPENLEIYKDGKWQPLIDKTSTLLEEAKKYKSAEEFVDAVQNSINKVALPPGKDRQYISELYKVGESNFYIGLKKQAKPPRQELNVNPLLNNDKFEIRLFELDEAVDENYSNAFLRSKNIKQTEAVGSQKFIDDLTDELRRLWEQSRA